MSYNKYRNKVVIKDGYVFDSIKEANRYLELLLEEQAGAIRDLKIHPTFVLQESFESKHNNLSQKKIRALTYTPDFQYYDVKENMICIEDVKPKSKKFSVTAYMIKRKLFLKKYPDYFFQEIL